MYFDFNDLNKHAERTNAILRTSILNAAGWSVNIHDPSLISGTQVYMYIYDQLTKWTWMVAAPRDAFLTMTLETQKMSDDKIAAIRGMLGYFISIMATKDTNDADYKKVEADLGIAMALYCGTTRTWKLSGDMVGGGNFILNNYRTTDTHESLLRPFIVGNNNNQPLSPAELFERVEGVFQLDQVNHPEWFKTPRNNI